MAASGGRAQASLGPERGVWQRHARQARASGGQRPGGLWKRSVPIKCGAWPAHEASRCRAPQAFSIRRMVGLVKRPPAAVVRSADSRDGLAPFGMALVLTAAALAFRWYLRSCLRRRQSTLRTPPIQCGPNGFWASPAPTARSWVHDRRPPIQPPARMPFQSAQALWPPEALACLRPSAWGPHT